MTPLHIDVAAGQALLQRRDLQLERRGRRRPDADQFQRGVAPAETPMCARPELRWCKVAKVEATTAG